MLCCFTEHSCALNLNLFPVCGSQRCLFLFLEAASSWNHHPSAIISCVRTCVSPSHTHFKVQMLSRRRWRVTFMLPFFILRLQKRDNVRSRCFSGHDKCFKNPKQQRKMGFLLSRGLFKTCKVIRILLWHQRISVY